MGEVKKERERGRYEMRIGRYNSFGRRGMRNEKKDNAGIRGRYIE